MFSECAGNVCGMYSTCFGNVFGMSANDALQLRTRFWWPRRAPYSLGVNRTFEKSPCDFRDDHDVDDDDDDDDKNLKIYTTRVHHNDSYDMHLAQFRIPVRGGFTGMAFSRSST